MAIHGDARVSGVTLMRNRLDTERTRVALRIELEPRAAIETVGHARGSAHDYERVRGMAVISS